MASARKSIKTIAPRKVPMPHLSPESRSCSFDEVALGYTEEDAIAEASRCLSCARAKCVLACPVSVDIPSFVSSVADGNFREAYYTLNRSNALPSICGRVCPQESQCEAECVVGRALEEPVAIGRLERFVGDLAIERGWKGVASSEGASSPPPYSGRSGEGLRAAVVGSGPAGITCAVDLARAGCDVTLYEALHTAGGVLKYGIPEFRLPKRLIDAELGCLEELGVKVELNSVIGTLYGVEQLLGEMGYASVFIASGAGYPTFMGIEGESLNGVCSANEFLTRVNLMKAYDGAYSDTPVGMGDRVAVIGSGNTAMDSCRVALRLGAKSVCCIYRRSERECPARAEELEHAKEEGVEFQWLANPTRIIGDERGWVSAIECVEMELGEEDSSGRRRPLPVEGSEYLREVDTVIYAIGTSANPIIPRNTPGLALNSRGYIEVDPDTQMSSLAGVFAGGDIVTGSATVILAMGAGRKAAAAMLDYMSAD